MKPRTTLAQTTTPTGEPLELVEHDGRYYLHSQGAVLMSTGIHFSEEELARLACAPSRAARKPAILIGGLGFGYTLAAATKALPQQGTTFLVAEQSPDIIEWNQKYLTHLHPELWNDHRVLLEPRPVQDLIAENPAAFSAILLDVDNGPWAFQDGENEDLYSIEGLESIKSALKPGGVLGVWSLRPDKSFDERLRKVGFEVSCERVAASTVADIGKKPKYHTIWLAANGCYVSPHQ